MKIRHGASLANKADDEFYTPPFEVISFNLASLWA
jgi:hypothetical protein